MKKITSYIDNITKDVNLDWKYGKIFNNSKVLTLLKIRESNRVIISSLRQFDESLTTEKVFYNLLALHFIYKLSNAKNYSYLLLSNIDHSVELKNIISFSSFEFLEKIKLNFGKNQFIKYRSILLKFNNYILILLKNYFYIAKSQNCLHHLIEEYDLINTIELYKKN